MTAIFDFLAIPLGWLMSFIYSGIPNYFAAIFLFTLNKTIKAIPEPVNNPASIDPKLIEEFKYNSVITILEAQLGIKPIKLEIKGLNIEPFSKMFDNLSVPK